MRARNDALLSVIDPKIDVVMVAPPADLSFAVEKLWSLEWDVSRHEAVIVSDPAVTLVFESEWTRIVGVHTGTFKRTLFGRGRFSAAKFFPGAFRFFHDVPVDELNNRQVSLVDATGFASERSESILEPPEFAGLIDYLRTSLTAENRSAERATEIASAIASDPTICTASEVSRRFDINPRSLQRLMRGYVGVSAKWLIVRYRLRDAVAKLKDPEASIAAVALQLGYFDQAHFSREFKSTTGITPATFIQEHVE